MCILFSDWFILNELFFSYVSSTVFLSLGVSHTNGSTADAFDMDSLNQDLPQNKKKSAEAFLGGHANLVNLDQLVSKAPPKGKTWQQVKFVEPLTFSLVCLPSLHSYDTCIQYICR